MDVMTPPRADASIGHNLPPEETKREELTRLAREIAAAGSAWINEVPTITTQAQADHAAGFKKQCRDLVKRLDEAKAEEKRPHLDANAKIEKFFKDLIAKVDLAVGPVSTKLTAFLVAEDARKKAEAEAARKIAEEAEKQAQLAADKAYDLYDKAERGELAGTGINTVAALQEAEKAREEADKLAEDAERAGNQRAGAGGQYTVGGIKRTVTLRTSRSVVLDLPEKVTQAQMVKALKDLVLYIEKGGEGPALRTEMGKLVNRIFKKTDQVPPGCRVVENQAAV